MRPAARFDVPSARDGGGEGEVAVKEVSRTNSCACLSVSRMGDVEISACRFLRENRSVHSTPGSVKAKGSRKAYTRPTRPSTTSRYTPRPETVPKEQMNSTREEACWRGAAIMGSGRACHVSRHTLRRRRPPRAYCARPSRWSRQRLQSPRGRGPNGVETRAASLAKSRAPSTRRLR